MSPVAARHGQRLHAVQRGAVAIRRTIAEAMGAVGAATPCRFVPRFLVIMCIICAHCVATAGRPGRAASQKSPQSASSSLQRLGRRLGSALDPLTAAEEEQLMDLLSGRGLRSNRLFPIETRGQRHLRGLKTGRPAARYLVELDARGLANTSLPGVLPKIFV